MDLTKYTYQNLMSTALGQVPDTVDKSEGSIIYDALAPACYVLAQMYLDLQNAMNISFVETSYGEYLDKITSQFGVYRLQATYAVKRAEFKDANDNYIDISIGDRFQTNDSSNLIYKATKKISTGIFEMTCETAGVAGNSYTGSLVAVTYITNIATATMGSSIILARDIETDDSLKARYIDLMNQKPFGGNKADYIEKVKEISGVGDVQIYPIWNGGGTVKLSLVDTNYNPLEPQVVQSIQDEIDPTPSGTGLGIAPIGHTVTVTTPIELSLDVTADINTESGVTIEQVQQDVEENIQRYLGTIRKEFGTDVNGSYVKTIYVSQILAAIINTDGVTNTVNVKVNDDTQDIELMASGVQQQQVVLGTVTLSEAS